MKTVRHLFALILLTVFGFALSQNCAPYLSEGNEPCPCKDGWMCCWGVCFPQDYPCSQDAGTDESDAGGDPGGGDVGDDSGQDKSTWPYCSCKNPLDAMMEDIQEVRECYREGFSCNALNPCEEGYYCIVDWCVCEDLDVCGIDCSSGCICPSGLVCDEGTGICRLPLGCLDDRMCPDGQACRLLGPSHYLFDYFQCAEPTGRSTGQPCEYNWDCLSGVCDRTRVCLDACRSNRDCPQGQFCHQAEYSTLGCVIESECGQSCGGDDEFCKSMGECRNDNCRTHADCPGDCRLRLDSPVIGECAHSSLCEDDEIILEAGDGEFCLIYQACWTDLDCADPYRCTSELLNRRGGANVCGRIVRGRCEGDCPEGTVCDFRTATCTEALFCLEDEMCPQGTKCIDGSPTINGNTCAAPRGGELGEPCHYPSDCRSGVCHAYSTCVQSCRTNSDCPAGQFCGEAGYVTLGCLSQTHCGSSCSGPSQFCDGTECRDENCGTGADCTGDCAIYITQPEIRICEETAHCADSEFASRPVEFCMIHQSCRSDEDCSAPYRCVTSEELMISNGPSFCGRQP